MESEDYLNAFEHYYDLKNKYNKYIRKIKNRIKRLDISDREKKEMFKRQKIKCIHCKKPGGTIFTEKNRILKATCGNPTKKCKLHIEIKKSVTLFIPTALEKARKNLEIIKQMIIKVKLAFLFDLENETQTTQTFEKYKKRFDEYFAYVTNLETMRQRLYHLNERLAEIEKDQLQLYIFNEEFKQIIENYKEKPDPKLMTNAIELYINQIVPTEEKIQDNKYTDIHIEPNEEENKFYLKSNIVDIRQKEEIWKEGKVIANTKK